MSYLRSSQGPKSSAYYRRAIPAVAMVVLFLLRGPITNVLFPIILRLAEPLWNIRNILVGNPERENIFEANRVLEARLVQVAIDTDVRGDTTSAHILSSLAVSPYGTILIDKGLRQDIELGDTVVTGEGISLGKVVEVFDNSAKVSLYSVYGESLEVSTEDGTRFIVVGAGNQNFEARLPRKRAILAWCRLSKGFCKKPVKYSCGPDSVYQRWELTSIGSVLS